MSVIESHTRWVVGVGAAVAVLATVGLRAPTLKAADLSARLTTVGFALVNMTANSASTPLQLQINFQETTETIKASMSLVQQAMAKVTTRIEKAGVKANAITQQGQPSLNNQDGSWQVSTTLQVNFRSMTQLATVADKTEVTDNPAVQNIFVNSPSSTMKATAAAVAAGYASAVQNSARTAAFIASADHRKLGTVVSIEEGAGDLPSQSLGYSSASLGINPPQPGANQEVLAVTVTYRTLPS